MDDVERIELIRKGNELFNQKNYKEALKIFLQTNYIDGIIRVADYLYFEKNDKISAVKLYKRAGYKKMIEEFSRKAAEIIKLYLQEDIIENIDSKIIKGEENTKKIEKWEPVILNADEITDIINNDNEIVNNEKNK